MLMWVNRPIFTLNIIFTTTIFNCGNAYLIVGVWRVRIYSMRLNWPQRHTNTEGDALTHAASTLCLHANRLGLDQVPVETNRHLFCGMCEQV